LLALLVETLNALAKPSPFSEKPEKPQTMRGRLKLPSLSPPPFISLSFLFPSLSLCYCLPAVSIASHEAPIQLDFFLALSASSEAFYLLSCTSTKKSSAISFILCGFCGNWRGYWIENFQSRSTHLCQFLYTTHLSTVTTVVLCFQWHQPPLIPIPTARRVGCTRQQVDLFHRRVQAQLSPSLFTASAVGFWWRAVLMCGESSPEAGAWYTRAGHGDSHLLPWFFLCWFLFLMLYFGHLCFFWFLVLYILIVFSVWLRMVLGSFGFLIHRLPPLLVAPFLSSVSRTNRPASSEALLPCTFVLSFSFLLFRVAQP
jgi:hypothetical protein